MTYEFGPFKLDARERVLRKHGAAVPLTPKSFDLLLAFVQNSRRVLTKQEMMQLVWHDSVVEESNLARQVSTLRRVLGNGSAEGYIETIPWRGYRFTAAVRHNHEESARIDSLAVLPFQNESDDEAPDYLSDGLTDTLINSLSLLPDLKVMSRNSVYRYKVREPDGSFVEANVVGTALGVRAVLTGRMRQERGNVIVSVELIDTRDNRQLWGARYRLEFSDIFVLQQTISGQIVDHLRLKLTSTNKRHLSKRHTENSEAWHLYLKGRFFLNKLTPDGIRKAAELFREAIATDPNFALAYTGLLDTELNLNNVSEARAAAVKALELDPSLGEAHASLGFLTLIHDWDWRKAELELERAIALNPNYAPAYQWYALFLAKFERHEEAIEAARRAMELDPLSLSMNLTMGVVLCFARQYDRAIEEMRKLIEMDANFAAAHSMLGLAYTYRKMCDEAIAEFRKVQKLAGGAPEVETTIDWLTAYCYAVCGKSKQAKTVLKRLSTRPAVSSYVLGMIYAQLGEPGVALDCLERAYRERNVQLVCLRVDPALDPLRSDRRFQNLLARVGF